MKKYWFGIIYTFLLVAFTFYLLMDTFVIERVYESVIEPSGESTEKETVSDSQVITGAKTDTEQAEDTESDLNVEMEASPELSEPIITDNYYEDGNIIVSLKEYRENETAIYVADIIITSPEYLKTALAKDSYGKNVTEKTSTMAERNKAVIAVNGDYYGVRERGYVIRNGVLYRSAAGEDREDLVIYDDGSFDIINESLLEANELLEGGAEQVLSFGPALIIDGRISVDEDDEVSQSMRSNPRTAIGIIEKGHYLMVVSDGRTKESAGLSLYELAEFMQSLGAVIAYNLDGGGSATMYFCGEIINKPTSNGKSIKERSVSDIVYIGY